MRLVHVNWPREPGDSAVDNPMWDTHAQNADRLQDVLCPQFDVAFAALIDDLDAARPAGRDAGRRDRRVRPHAEDQQARRPRPLGPRLQLRAGRGRASAAGRCIGASDKNGALPARPTRSAPHDLTATIFHLLGIDPSGMFRDKTNRPHPLTQGRADRRRCSAPPGDDRALRARRRPGLRAALRHARCCSTPTSSPACRCSPPRRRRAQGLAGLSRSGTQSAGNAFSVRSDRDCHVMLGFGLGDGERCP